MCKIFTLLFMISIFCIPTMSQEYNLKEVKEIHDKLEIEPKDEEWIDYESEKIYLITKDIKNKLMYVDVENRN